MAAKSCSTASPAARLELRAASEGSISLGDTLHLIEARLVMLGQHRNCWRLGETPALEATETEGTTDDWGSLG